MQQPAASILRSSVDMASCACAGNYCDQCHGALGGDILQVAEQFVAQKLANHPAPARNFLPALVPIVSQVQVIYVPWHQLRPSSAHDPQAELLGCVVARCCWYFINCALRPDQFLTP